MDSGLLHLHSLLRWVILLLLVLTLVQAIRKNPAIQKLSLPLLITAHIMLLIGLYQWIFGRYGLTQPLPAGISRMKDPFYRFYQIEHPTLMILATVLITVVRGKAKKLQYKAVVGLLIAAFLLLMAGIPWPFRGEVIGRSLLPGM